MVCKYYLAVLAAKAGSKEEGTKNFPAAPFFKSVYAALLAAEKKDSKKGCS